MAEELKVLTERIKQSADKAYALKGEGEGGAGGLNLEISYEGGGVGTLVNPRAVIIQDGMSAYDIRQYIIDHIATIPNAQKENSIVYAWNETRPAILGTNVNLHIEKDIGGSKAYGISYASKKDWLFVMDRTNNILRVLKGSDLSEVMTIDTDVFGSDSSTRLVSTTPDAKRVAISQAQNGNIRILKLKDDSSGYELESSIDTGGDNRVGGVSLDGVGATLAFATYLSKQVKIYDLNGQGTWVHNKTYAIGLNIMGVEISKDGLEIYTTATDGNVRGITKVDGAWGDIASVAVLPSGYGATEDKYMSLSLDNQVLYVSDGGYDGVRGRVSAFYKREDETWQHKYDIQAPSPVANNYFGLGVALNDDNSVAFISEYVSHKVYKYDIQVPSLNIDANSLDPFEDGSLKHFYPLDIDAIDKVGNNNGTWVGTEGYKSAKFGNGANFGNNNSKNIVLTDIIALSLHYTINFWMDFSKNTTSNARCLSCNHDGRFYINVDSDDFTFRFNTDTTLRYTQVQPGMRMATILVDDIKNTSSLFIDSIEVATVSGVYDYKIHHINGDEDDNRWPIDSIDHLQIFDRALTQEEVTKLYEAEVK